MGVNFVPTFTIKGELTLTGLEVYPQIYSLAGNGFSEAFTHLREQAGNKIALVQGFLM